MKREFGSVSLSCLALLCSLASGNTERAQKPPEFARYFYTSELLDLQNQISQFSSLQKSAAGNQGGAILDKQALIFPTDRDPLDVALRRTEALLADLKKGGLPKGALFEARLSQLKRTAFARIPGRPADMSPVRQELFMQTMALRREIAAANPLMNFDSLLFITSRIADIGGTGHIIFELQGRYYGGNDGQSLCLAKDLKSGNPTVINIAENAKCTNGRFAGKTLANGSFMSPDLSFDGKTVVFAWREPGARSGAWSVDWAFNKERCWHIFKINVDGTSLVQLTDGDYNDIDPCWLPDGRIAFVTERRGGYGRCHSFEGKTFTIYSMKNDGSDMICIDYHETNEWQPSVDNNGMIVYSRWDYVDRDAIVAHNMWIMYPDGRDSRSYTGNYPLPWSTIPGTPYFDTVDGRLLKPMTEFYIRAIPGSNRYVATVTGHHSYPWGDLVLIDPTVPDDNKNSQITGITTPTRAKWYDRDNPTTYQAAWPLSEAYYICPFQTDIVLVDKFGNKELILPRSKVAGAGAACRLQDPIPLRPRPTPPALPTRTFQGERKNHPDHKRAVISIMNVGISDIPLPQGVKIKELRIVQVIPKETYNANSPRTSYPEQALCRMSLGTVPVEPDGSVYCEAPIEKSIYFQILDERGCAIQSMRSDTWVHAGEHLTCFGCHEDKWTATPPANPIATKRPPSQLKPEFGTSVEPLTYYRSAKPVFDAKCAPCHRQQAKGPDMSYKSLQKYAFCYEGVQDNVFKLPHDGIFNGSRSTPGKVGALGSLLMSHLDTTHHNVKLSSEEMRRVTLWLDLVSMELGAYFKENEQRAGQLVWPTLDCDPKNPQGVEKDFPLPDALEINFKTSPMAAAPVIQPSLEIQLRGTAVSIANPGRADLRLTLFDVAGRRVRAETFRKPGAMVNVDLKNWSIARGLYVLQALTEKSSARVMTARVQ